MAIKKASYNLNLNLPESSQKTDELAAQALLANLLNPQAQSQEMPPEQQPQEPIQRFGLPAPSQFDPSKYPEMPAFTPFSETEQGRGVIEELSKRRQQAVEKQQEEMNAAKLQLQDYLSKQKSVDFLPLAALVDTWTGSNMARYFKDDQDKNKELALALQQELLKYGQAGVTAETQALQDRLGLGSEESKQLQQLAQNKYEADLRAKAALDNAQLDAATRLRVADDARKAAMELEKFRQSEAYRRALLRKGERASTEARQQRSEDRQTAFKLVDSPEFKSENSRLKLLGILDDYEKAVREIGLKVKPSEAKTKLQNIYQRFVSSQKEADNLGALTGSDLAIVWGQMPDATSLLYYGESFIGGGGEKGILNSISRARNEIERDHRIASEKLRTGFGGLSPDADKRIDKFDENFNRTFKKLQAPSELPKIGTQPPETKPATLEQKKAYLEELKKKKLGK